MTARRLVLPIVGRHLRREFLRTFALTLGAFIAIYVVVDFFDRFDSFLRHDATLGAVVRSFLYKLPLIITQVTPIAVLGGALVGLGLLGRQNEFVALRACGVSIWQIALPLVGAAAFVSVAVIAWNETVVPWSAHRWHEVENLEIKKRGLATVFAGREVWYHGRAGFYNIDRFGLRRSTLYGLTVYDMGPDFRPRRIVEAPSATWDGKQWQIVTPRTVEFGEDGVRSVAGTPPGFTLPETLEDFRVVAIEPEEFSYAMLRQQIDSLRLKGIDASESWVDLHLKLALPAASLIMMLVAIPLAARGTRVSSLAAGVGLGFVLGFGYFVLVAFARALGQGGTLPPLVAAWAANGVFLMLAGYYLLGGD